MNSGKIKENTVAFSNSGLRFSSWDEAMRSFLVLSMREEEKNEIMAPCAGTFHKSNKPGI